MRQSALAGFSGDLGGAWHVFLYLPYDRRDLQKSRKIGHFLGSGILPSFFISSSGKHNRLTQRVYPDWPFIR